MTCKALMDTVAVNGRNNGGSSFCASSPSLREAVKHSRGNSKNYSVMTSELEDKNATIVGKLKAATKPVMVQVAPGKFAPWNDAEAPEITLCRWSKEQDGTYSPIPFEERFVRLGRQVIGVLGLGQNAYSTIYHTIRRLGKMGCIEIIQIAPRVTLLNLNSWFNHLRRCAEDPFLWDEDGAYIKEYRKIFD